VIRKIALSTTTGRLDRQRPGLSNIPSRGRAARDRYWCLFFLLLAAVLLAVGGLVLSLAWLRVVERG
jgi:hypothetical protein